MDRRDCVKEDIQKCLDCGTNYVMNWIGGTTLKFLGNIAKKITNKSQRDEIAACI